MTPPRHFYLQGIAQFRCINGAATICVYQPEALVKLLLLCFTDLWGWRATMCSQPSVRVDCQVGIDISEWLAKAARDVMRTRRIVCGHAISHINYLLRLLACHHAWRPNDNCCLRCLGARGSFV